MRSPSATGSIGALAVGVPGVAELLSISERQVEKMHATGQLPSPIRFGRRRLWSVRELADWIHEGAPARDTWGRIKAGRS